MPSLLDDWRLWTQHYPTAEIYVDSSYWFLISSALQRRVWFGDRDHKPIMPNLYMFFVAEPGVGKGLMTSPVKEFLGFHKRTVGEPGDEQHLVESALYQGLNGNKVKPMFNVGADSTTFEAMAQETARSTQTVTYKPTKPRDSGIYVHNSVTFILDEATSIFQRYSERTVNLFLTSYMGENFINATKHMGVDVLINPCITLLAGTQPDTMMQIAGNKYITNGFLSRTMLLYAARNRFYRLQIPPPDDAQLAARERILAHLKRLHELYGPVEFTPEAAAFLTDWWENPDKRAMVIVNKAPRLSPYYERKNLHVQKLALAMHFGESAEKRPVELYTAKCALDTLCTWEKDMHMCLSGGYRNELAGVANQILRYISRNVEASMDELFAEFYGEAQLDEIQSVLGELKRLNKIRLKAPNTNIWTLVK